MKTKTRHQKWRERYGNPRRDNDGNIIGRWTYRAIAQDFGVDPSTVWAVVNRDKLKARRKEAAALRPPREPRPKSVRLALNDSEYVALKARGKELPRPSMMEAARRILFGEAPPLLLEPPLESDSSEPRLET